MSDVDEKPRQSDPLMGPIDFEAARRLALAIGLFKESKGEFASSDFVRANPRSLRGRFRHLRAAFVGDVRMSFLAVIAMAAIFLTGWVVASGTHKALLQEQIQKERLDARLDALRGTKHRFDLWISRMRESDEENEAYIEFSNRMHADLQAIWNEQQESSEDQPDQRPP